MNTGADAADVREDSFVDAWRARWPEWTFGAVFVPAAQREVAFEWFALLQVFTDAAWSGPDPTPGLAKLAWWSEELRGWSKGARRHPLGQLLQRQPADWTALAATLRELPPLRDAPLQDAQSQTAAGFAAAVADIDAVVLATAGARRRDAGGCADLLAERVLLRGDEDLARRLLAAVQPACDAPRARRIHAAFVRSRLARLAAGQGSTHAAPLRSLLTAWRAARGR